MRKLLLVAVLFGANAHAFQTFYLQGENAVALSNALVKIGAQRHDRDNASVVEVSRIECGLGYVPGNGATGLCKMTDEKTRAELTVNDKKAYPMFDLLKKSGLPNYQYFIFTMMEADRIVCAAGTDEKTKKPYNYCSIDW